MAEIKRLQLGVANRFTVGLFVGLEHRQNRKKLFKAANNFLKSDLQTIFFLFIGLEHRQNRFSIGKRK
jgi:hypothetical protein